MHNPLNSLTEAKRQTLQYNQSFSRVKPSYDRYCQIVIDWMRYSFLTCYLYSYA